MLYQDLEPCVWFISERNNQLYFHVSADSSYSYKLYDGMLFEEEFDDTENVRQVEVDLSANIFLNTDELSAIIKKAMDMLSVAGLDMFTNDGHVYFRKEGRIFDINGELAHDEL